jgi:cytochrome c553
MPIRSTVVLLFAFAFAFAFAAPRPLFAQETTSCVAQCSADKQACRQSAEHRADVDLDPPIAASSNHDPFPYQGQDMTAVLHARQDHDTARRKLRTDRYSGCEAESSRCAAACARSLVRTDRATSIAMSTAPAADAPSFLVPDWAFPHPQGPAPAPADAGTPRSLPGSTRQFTDAELNDIFAAPDWFPQSHSPMPSVVARGVKPDVYACGYCHTPGGQGRPENASLAGLPVGYIVRQVGDFRSGARRSASTPPFGPSVRMAGVAAHLGTEDQLTAAAYFSRQPLSRRVNVHEQATVPRTVAVGYLYGLDPKGGEEPLGERLVELAPDIARHELRDERLVYEAYVPPGSFARGRTLAEVGAAPGAACEACHGPGLRGAGEAPPLAGRPPTYLLRQLLAFRTGTRNGLAGQPMRAVAAGLSLQDMIAAAGYAASLAP